MEKEFDLVEARMQRGSIVLEKRAQEVDRFLKQMSAAQEKQLAQQEKNEVAAQRRISELKAEIVTAERNHASTEYIENLKRQQDEAVRSEKAAQESIKKYKAQIAAQKDAAEQAAAKKELNRYKSMRAQEKYEYAKTLQDNIAQKQRALSAEIKDTKSAIAQQEKILQDASSTTEQKEAARRAKRNLTDSLQKKESEKATLDDQATKAPKASALRSLLPKNIAATIDAGKKSFKESGDSRRQYSVAAKDAKALVVETEAYKKLQETKKRGNKEEIRVAQQRLEDTAEYKALLAAEDELKKQSHKEFMEGLKLTGAEVLSGLGDSAKKVADKVGSSIEDNLGVLYGSQSKMMGRLQGSAIEWNDAVKDVSATIGMSGVVSKKNVIQKMVELVDSGVAYNLEMRAFLAETAQDIASTFDATNGTLLRMIRLQQADTTAARLGMEASLTKLFNNFFEDSSYLAGQVSDAISDKILDASATMSHDNAVEFEYILQKWLGSLYSVGMSQSAVELIAEGINYLGTGNVGALNSNDTLQTLLAMSAARSGGKSYAELLLGGIDGSETNKLLKGMITYLAEIASNQTNYVTKAAYADLFGMSVTDLSVFASLTAEEITRLYDNTLTYNNMLGETEHQLQQIITRRSLSQLVDTAIDNAEMGAAATIGSNAFTYGTWKAINVLQDYVGEIKIPSVLAAGFGLSSDIDLLNVAKTGMVGIGMLGSLIEGIGSMMSGGPTILSNWSGSEFTHRGSGLKILDTGALKTSSYSAVIGVGSASGEDVQQASLTSATDAAYANSNTSAEDVEEGKEIPKKIYELIGGDTQETVVGMLSKIHSLISEIELTTESSDKYIQILADPHRVSYTAITGVVSNNSLSTLSNLANDVTTQYYRNGVSAAVKADDNSTDVIKPGIKFTSASGTSQNIEVDSVESVLETAIAKAVEAAIAAALQNATTKVSIAGIEPGVNLLGGY